MTPRRVVAVLAFFAIARVILAGDPPPPPGAPPSVPPAEARKTLGVAQGLDAQEPMVQQPVSITFDDRGRLWVLEYLQYPIPNGVKAVEVDQYLRTGYDKVPEPPPRGPLGADKVIILDDPDESGRYRSVKEFVTGLDLASGFALGDDGLYVAQPPYLLFYPDRDHDDRPDGDPEVLLKGFGMEDAHAFANSLTWGPDGWLYGAQGSTVTANIRGIEFQQGIWRYHPRTRRFELFAEGGGNTWGIDFDRHGRLFAGGNTTEPLCHHVQGGYYVKGFGKHGPLHNPYSFGYINPVNHGFLGTGLSGGMVSTRAGSSPSGSTAPRSIPTSARTPLAPAASNPSAPRSRPASRRTSSSPPTDGFGRSRASSGPTVRSTWLTGTTTTSATPIRRTAASGTSRAARPGGSGG